MKQVVQSAKTGDLKLKEVPAPSGAAPGTLLVRTRASLISAGTERMVIDFAKKSLAGKAKARPDLVKKVLTKAKRDGLVSTFKAVMARLDEPMPLGYSAAGEVVAVGAGLEGVYTVGQRVACAGAGIANHAELNVVPRNLAAPIPDGVPDEEACFGTVGAIALHGVRNLKPELGDVVVVMGAGLVGQMTVGFLSLSGVRAVVLDYNAARLDLAKTMGAEVVWNLSDTAGLLEAVAAMTDGTLADGIIIAAATDSSEPLETAAELARDRAKVVMVGKTGTEFSYAAFMKKELSVMVSRSYGPGRYDEDFESRGVKYPPGFVRWTETANLAESVRLMDPALKHRLDVAPLISHRFGIDDSEAAYTLVTKGTEPSLGVVLEYPEGGKTEKTVFAQAKGTATGAVKFGVIGAGSFARTVLLPELKRIDGVSLKTLVTTRGMTAEHGLDAYGFTTASTEASEVFNDPDINAVLIATRHSSHAKLTAQALAAGKNVIVEKPLGLDRDELNAVVEARNASQEAREPGGRTGNAQPFFSVGFNRRFAPLSVKMRAHLAKFDGPKVVNLRVNAGALPPETWVNAAEEGGGRLLGEGCHFIDLARYFVGADIASVLTESAGNNGACDDIAVALRFVDGSLATITYTAQGDTAYSKERFEGFAGGTVVTLDNFLELAITANGKTSKETAKLGQDKGHRAELEAFVAAVKAGGPAPVAEAELLHTSLATVAAVESLRHGERVIL